MTLLYCKCTSEQELVECFEQSRNCSWICDNSKFITTHHQSVRPLNSKTHNGLYLYCAEQMKSDVRNNHLLITRVMVRVWVCVPT